jgi:hypothetical protein
MKPDGVPAELTPGQHQRGISGIAAGAFWFYKRCVSPLVHAIAPTGCRYLPTCSEYAYTALVRFGVWRGGWLSVKRLMRCHPWAKPGFDPVPERVSGLKA